MAIDCGDKLGAQLSQELVAFSLFFTGQCCLERGLASATMMKETLPGICQTTLAVILSFASMVIRLVVYAISSEVSFDFLVFARGIRSCPVSFHVHVRMLYALRGVSLALR